jgi:cysteine desulfurase
MYVRRGVPLLPEIDGGAQERRRRASTENVAGIVGLATALRLAQEGRASYNAHCEQLRDRLIDGILERIPFARLNGHRTERLPNNASFCFEFVEGEGILLKLDQRGIAASSGSACTSGTLEPSHVLIAMGVPTEIAHGSLRLTVGRKSTSEQVEHVLEVLPGIIEELRAISPLYAEHVRTTAVH